MIRLVPLFLLLSTGCLSLSGLTKRSTIESDIGRVDVYSRPGWDRDEKQTLEATRAALKGLRQWGTFDRPVSFYLVPTHAHLEWAIGRWGRDIPWLRGWATYEDVYFQAPSSWGVKVSDAEMKELALHELTHCLMYQRSGSPSDWVEKEIPVWFREGMATWTANQGHKFPSLEELARFYERHPGADPINDPEPLLKDQNHAVYTASHHAFTFFIRRYGKQNVHRILDGMKAGRRFAEAFQLATGISATAFGRELKHYVVWRGFKGVGTPKLFVPEPALTPATVSPPATE